MLNQNKYLRLNEKKVTDYLERVPYDIGRETLYSVHDLFDTFDPDDREKTEQCYDIRVYRHFLRTGLGQNCKDPLELWARTCHDAAILRAMYKMLEHHDPLKVVGIMGGHGVSRTNEYYRKVVHIAKKLTEGGWLIATGGGPGAMEAAHLGARLAGRGEEDVEKCLSVLSEAPLYSDSGWYSTAYKVLRMFPDTRGYESLAIPTWLYGHEPPAFFASHCAKLFDNAVREDTLISISYGGLIFMPGSAGTLEEVFLGVERNHYLASKYPAPMIFVGREHWTKTVPFYSVVCSMLKNRSLRNLMSALVDNVDEIYELISDYPHMLPLIQSKLDGDAMSREALLEIEKIHFPEMK